MTYGVTVCDSCGVELKTEFNRSYPIEHDRNWMHVRTEGNADCCRTLCPDCSMAVRIMLQAIKRKK